MSVSRRRKMDDRPPEEESRPLVVFLLSGGTGRTAEEVLRSGLAQFDDPQLRIERRPRVRTARRAVDVINEAAEVRGIVLHTLVVPAIRDAARKAAARLDVTLVDLIGSTLSVLSDHLQQPARLQAGLSYRVQKERIDRQDAVDFTLSHDDGAGLRDLHHADVVLVGPSRVSKSVTCFYLAYRGVRAANVPLIVHHAIPRELAKMDRRKVIVLTMSARRLASLRMTRMSQLSPEPLAEYADMPVVMAELRQSAELASRYRWRSIDVSYKAVEEVAVDVLDLIGW